MAVAFAVTLFLSAALLFLVQPMVGKLALPLLGGTPAVWTTCMVFYQAILLAGYLYAHLTTRALGPRRQSRFHQYVLMVPLAVMAVAAASAGSPIAIWSDLMPRGAEFPVPGVLAVLFVAIGVPLFVVSSTAPLLQRWFADTDHPDAGDPYFLYSASNLGSFLALIAYPVAVEPNFLLRQQAWAWAVGYAVLAGLVALCGRAVRSSRPPVPRSESAAGPSAPVTLSNRLYWLALAAVPSSMMLAVTAYATTDIAPIPLLWVIPLGIYLLTFVIAFGRPPWIVSLLAELLPPVFLLIQLFFVTTEHQFRTPSVQIGAHFVAFGAAAMMCHWQLAKHRPATSGLTEFYLWVSLGGVVGGLFNAVVAPLAFDALTEYPVAILAACLLVPSLHPDTGRRRLARLLDLVVPLAVTALAFALVWGRDALLFPKLCSIVSSVLPDKWKVEDSWLQTLLVYGAPLILTYLWVDRPVRFGSCAIGVWLAAGLAVPESRPILQQRSFFGVLKVDSYPSERDGEPVVIHKLVHGTTMHGEQVYSPPSADPEPLSYYARSGPIGDVFANVPASNGPLALIGLGTGSLTAYGRTGQSVTVYEIDPLVKRIATDPELFTYVESARKRGVVLEIVMGDARLRLADAPDGRYGLIAVDAFSSDSIPVHLLTREAIELYFRKLKPDGVVALHVSNRYLDLEAVVGRLAAATGKEVLAWYDDQKDVEGRKARSHWVVLANRAEHFGTLAQLPDATGATAVRWNPIEVPDDAPLWTDDFTNIWSIYNP